MGPGAARPRSSSTRRPRSPSPHPSPSPSGRDRVQRPVGDLTYPPTRLPTYPPTHLPTYPPTHLPAYPPTRPPTQVRAFRLIRYWPTMYRQLEAAAIAIPQIANCLILTACVMFVFAIVGMQTFGGTGLADVSRENFDSFGAAMRTVLNIFSLGFSELAKACYDEVGIWKTIVYFTPALIIGYLGMMNLFVAILVETCSSVRESHGLSEVPRDSQRFPEDPGSLSAPHAPVTSPGSLHPTFLHQPWLSSHHVPSPSPGG